MKIGYMLENQDTCNECFAKSMINLRKQSNGLDMVYFDDDYISTNEIVDYVEKEPLTESLEGGDYYVSK